MTRKEAVRQYEQAVQLVVLGFTGEEVEQLRRISMTLHRWHERECGSDSACIVRGRWDHVAQTFLYDDNGFAFEEYANGSGRGRYHRVPDREAGAKRRLVAILTARNGREEPIQHTAETCPGRPCSDTCDHVERHDGITIRAYIQTDPRGVALYLLRPGDVPDGERDDSHYSRGICVY